MSKKVIFIGSKELGLNVLKTLRDILGKALIRAVTFDDSKDIRTDLENFKSYTCESKLALDVINKPSSLEEIIEKEKPDLCIVVGWYWILSKSLLDKVPLGFAGIHASLLPKYRGTSPLVWAMINGEKSHGISFFRFDEGMDTGDIVAQEAFEIGPDESIADVLVKVEKLSIKIITENVPLMLAGEKTYIKQNHNEATYCSKRNPENGHINWNDDCKKIHDFIRAQTHPYPGAFSLLNDGKKLKIWKALPFPKEYSGIPGLVVQKNSDSVVITCGKGAITLEKVQIEGSSEEINASEILKYGQQLS